ISSLPAGAYTIVVNDGTPIHNWVIEGDGVKEATSVTGRGTSTFKVTFKPGEYRYHCDPHPNMNGSITVT
ncbi:MAG: cupredoxin domain-containing protein, partial [Frankiales bacterium]|nr:cupredoxin domain-containing protein [Frankiales bacterium]